MRRISLLVLLIVPVLSGQAYTMPYDVSGDRFEVIWLADGRENRLPANLRETASPDSLSPQITHIFESFTAEGFFNARLDTVRVSESRVRIETERGCRFRISAVEFSEKGDEEIIQDGFRPLLQTGQHYNNRRVEQDIQALISFYERRGHMLARVHVDTIEPDSGRCEVALGFNAEPGPVLTVSDQIMPELRRNNPEYIRLASGVREGARITPRLLRNARLNLENTGLFASVDEPGIAESDGEYIIIHNLEEQRTNAFDLIVGYVPQQGGGQTLVGTGHLNIRNAILSGSDLDIEFERLEQFVTRLDVGYEAQWLFGEPIGAAVSFHILQQDSTYQVRNIRLEGSYGLSATTNIIGTLRNEVTASTPRPGIPLTVLDGSGVYGGVGIVYRQTNQLINPTRGIEARFLAETGIRRINDDLAAEFTDRTRLRQQLFHGRLRTYVNPFRRQVIASSLNGFVNLTPEFTETDLHRFGGARSLRGYREEQFSGGRVVWADTEYRYLLDRYSNAFIFGAAGWYERPALITEPETTSPVREWLYSWGLGFSYNTPIGIMRFTYALSPEDSIGNGKVHFGISTRI